MSVFPRAVAYIEDEVIPLSTDFSADRDAQRIYLLVIIIIIIIIITIILILIMGNYNAPYLAIKALHKALTKSQHKLNERTAHGMQTHTHIRTCISTHMHSYPDIYTNFLLWYIMSFLFLVIFILAASHSSRSRHFQT